MSIVSKADLHVHTDASDGTASVQEVLGRAASLGLAVVAITDHDTIDGALEARSEASRFGLEVIVGEEVSTTEGHLLVLFIETTLPAGRPAAETIQAAHDQGGLCIAAHPYDWAVPSLGKAGLHRRCSGTRMGEWQLDGIEGINASVTGPLGVPNYLAQRMARRLGLPVVAGSDAHTLATVGRAYTLFPGRTATDLRAALLNQTVSAVGQSWTTAETFDFYRQTVRQRGLRRAMALARSNLALPWQRKPQRQAAGASTFAPITMTRRINAMRDDQVFGAMGGS